MFCPEGFVPHCDVLSNVPERILSVYENSFAEERESHSVARLPAELQITRFFRRSTADQLQLVLLRWLGDRLFIASSAGETLRLGGMGMLLGNSISACRRFDIDLAEVPIPAGLAAGYFFSPIDLLGFARDFREHRAKRGKSSIWAFDLDRAFETGRGAIQDSRLVLPWWFEPTGYTIALDAHDLITAHPGVADLSRLSHAVKLLRKFEGWSLCLRESSDNPIWPHVPDAATDAEARELVARGPGRPRGKRESTGQAYAELFPNGNNGLTKKEVLAKVNARTGLDADQRTLQRAIKDAQNQAQN